MAPLKSLEQDYPAIDSNFQNFCSLHSIFSVEDFLLFDIDVLVASAANQLRPERLMQGITQLQSIIDAKSPPLLNGLELLEDTKRNKHVLPTGCEGIDAVLGGGLREGQLTELVGQSSSGKTQACLQSASTVAKMDKTSVVYLDTSNSFSPQRIMHFVGHTSGSVVLAQADHRPLEKVLDSIICYSVFNIFQMFDVLHQLEINLRSEMLKSDNHVRLLIVDSISSLITPILGSSGPQAKQFDGDSMFFYSLEQLILNYILYYVQILHESPYFQAMYQIKFLMLVSVVQPFINILWWLVRWFLRDLIRHALMISAGFLLKKLAYEHNLAVLVTNHMVGGEGGTSKPALGESWKSVPHAQLLLSRDYGANICNFIILKHPSLASGRAASCKIYDT